MRVNQGRPQTTFFRSVERVHWRKLQAGKLKVVTAVRKAGPDFRPVCVVAALHVRRVERPTPVCGHRNGTLR